MKINIRHYFIAFIIGTFCQVIVGANFEQRYGANSYIINRPVLVATNDKNFCKTYKHVPCKYKKQSHSTHTEHQKKEYRKVKNNNVPTVPTINQENTKSDEKGFLRKTWDTLTELPGRAVKEITIRFSKDS